ncbi:MAG: CBS domain-containing protein [Nitrososphaerota archaeon]|nr:CBS domain-containing protein [Nitrososphaerota archaeon]
MSSTVENLMSTKVVTVESSSSAFDAAREIMNHDIGCVVVVGAKGEISGVITKGDILREVVMKKLDPVKVKAEQVMSHPVITIGPRATLEDASRLMMENNLTKLPVTRGKELAGIITSTDIVRGSRPRKISNKDAI